MAGQIKRKLRETYQTRIPTFSGQVTSVGIGADGRSLGYILCNIGGSTLKVYCGPLDNYQPGDWVTVEQRGGAASAGYYAMGFISGVRSSSQILEVPSDTTINGVLYERGDLILGDPGAKFWHYDASQGAWLMQDTTALRGAIGNLDGLYGYSGTIYGTAFGAADGSHITIDETNGIRLFSGADQRVSIEPDGTGWLGGADKFYWDADGNVTMSGSLLTGAGTIFMNEDGFWLGDTDSGAGLTLNEVKDVYGVGTGSFGLRIYDESGVAHISLLSRAGDTPLFRLGTPAADTWLQWDENGLELKGAIKATSGEISGSLYVGEEEPRILIDGANKLIESTNYHKNVSGFRLDGETGSAEFEDITARGTIKTAVFQKSLVTAFAGSQVVAKSASVTAAETTLGSPTFSLAVKSQDEDAAPFVDGDLIYIKTELLSVYAIVNTGSRCGNLLENSTFNVDDFSDGVPNTWWPYNNTVGTEPHTASVIAYDGVDNGPFYRITWAANNTSTKGVLHLAAPWQPSTTYVISFYARASFVGTYPAMGLYWNYAPVSQVALANPTLTTEWQRYAFRIVTDVSPDTSLHISIINGSSCYGSLDIDHVMVEAGNDLNDWKADDYYSYTATYHSGATAGVIPIGTAVVDYGKNGDGRVFMTADDDAASGESPYLSIATHDMAKPPVWTERARLGNLEGLVPGGEYGLWTDNGWFTGIVTASVIRSAETGARIEMNTEKIFGTDGTDEQWYAQSADGKLYAGQGSVILDYDGLTIISSSADDDAMSFVADGNRVAKIAATWGPRFTGDTYDASQIHIAANPASTAIGSQVNITANGLTDNDDALIKIVSRAVPSYTSTIELGADRTYMAGHADIVGDLRAVRGGDTYTGGIFVPLTMPATAIGWTGTTFSTSSPQPLNVVSVFGIPADAKAISATLSVMDSAGAGNYYCSLGPNNTYYYALVCRSVSASYYNEVGPVPVPCQNGDVYYRVLASGTNTLTATLRIWGYWL